MPLTLGERAPAFRLRGIDNAYWVLGEPDKRRCVLVSFFHRESSASRLFLPFIERLHRRARAREAEVIGISLDGLRETVEFAQDYALTFPIVLDEPPGDAARSWMIDRVPTIYRLDAKLRVAQCVEGWTKASFAELAAAYLSETKAVDRTVWSDRDLPPDVAAADPVLRRRAF